MTINPMKAWTVWARATDPAGPWILATQGTADEAQAEAQLRARRARRHGTAAEFLALPTGAHPDQQPSSKAV